ncbi:J domain-containing protein [Novispirillum sp. DQ9]|uniref:J domain-containing protein n=1 Tax=Novispirillum sp. DQ9 TaxID=3398612 RepID=UPI003C7D6CEF
MSAVKASYTISCSSTFRDAVMALADRRQVNAGDLARSVMLVVPEAAVDAFADPGEPGADDRETVIAQSGRTVGKPWRRKPRLQVRLPPGLSPLTIRKALNLALALDGGTMALAVEDPTAAPPPPPPPDPRPAPSPPPPPPPPSANPHPEVLAEMARLRDDVERLHAVIGALAFMPLAEGVRTRAEALHVLGFPPNTNPDSRELRGRFRMLATIHHPDSAYGSHDRMSQINAAMDLLRRG